MFVFFLKIGSVAVSKPFGRHINRRSIRIIIFILNMIIPLLRSLFVPFQSRSVRNWHCFCTSIFGIVVEFRKRERKKGAPNQKPNALKKPILHWCINQLKEIWSIYCLVYEFYVFHRQKKWKKKRGRSFSAENSLNKLLSSFQFVNQIPTDEKKKLLIK